VRAWLGAALLAVAVACGGGGDGGARGALRETARNLDGIRSARMDLRMQAESAGGKAPVGFALSGPFALPEKQGLPVAEMTLTELRGAHESTVEFVSTGQEAYVVRDGRATKLSGGVSVGGEGGGLGTLRIDSWLRDPVMHEDGDRDVIASRLDVVRALDDLGRLGERLGTAFLAGLRPLDGTSKKALENAVEDSSITVWTGRDDRVLRRLEIEVVLGASGDVPAGLRSLVPVTLALTLELDDVNQPVRVEPPAT
jgi:hypothetical protein